MSKGWKPEGSQDFVQGTKDGSMRNRNYYSQALPPVNLPSLPEVTLHVTRSSRSYLSVYLRTANDQTLGVGTAWEQGYAIAMHELTCMFLYDLLCGPMSQMGFLPLRGKVVTCPENSRPTELTWLQHRT